MIKNVQIWYSELFDLFKKSNALCTVGNQGRCLAKDNGSMIMGVIPTKLEERGRASDLVDVTFRTDNLSDRKDVMLNESDVVIALPGGVGTLDEVFHVMAAATLDYHRKKVIFYNINGFWNGIIDFLAGLERQHFAHHPLNSYFAVANDLRELTELLK